MKHRSETVEYVGSLFRQDGFDDGVDHWYLEEHQVVGRTPEQVGRHVRAMMADSIQGGHRKGLVNKNSTWESALERASTPSEARRLFRYYLDGLETGIIYQARGVLNQMAFDAAEAADDKKRLLERGDRDKARHR